MSYCCPPWQTKGGGPEAGMLTPLLWSTDSAGFCPPPWVQLQCEVSGSYVENLTHHALTTQAKKPWGGWERQEPKAGGTETRNKLLWEATIPQPFYSCYYRGRISTPSESLPEGKCPSESFAGKEQAKVDGCESIHTQFCFPRNLLRPIYRTTSTSKALQAMCRHLLAKLGYERTISAKWGKKQKSAS